MELCKFSFTMLLENVTVADSCQLEPQWHNSWHSIFIALVMCSNASMVENVLQTGLVNDIHSSCRHHVVSLCEAFKVE